MVLIHLLAVLLLNTGWHLACPLFSGVVSLYHHMLARVHFKTALRCLTLCLLAALYVAFPGSTHSQGNTPGPPRAVKVMVKPEYSALAKRLNLNGAVRVEVLVAPDGKVRKAHVLGGHPVLAMDAEKAALMTEFEPGPKESTQILEFHFGSSN